MPAPGTLRTAVVISLVSVALITGLACIARPYLALEITLLTLLGVLLVAPILLPVLRGSTIEVLQPLHVFLAGYAMFLFVRPLYILVYEDFRFLNSRLGGGPSMIVPALLYAIVGLVACYGGYYSPLGGRCAAALAPPMEQVSARKIRDWGLGVILIGGLLYSLFLWQSRSMAGNPYHQSTAYFYLGIDLAGAGLFITFFWIRTVRNPAPKLLYAGAAICACVLFASMGSRYRLVYLVLSLYAGYHLFSKSRPRWGVALLSVPSALVVVAAIGWLRGGARQITADAWQKYDLVGSLHRFFSSSGDLTAFDVLTKILREVPGTLPYQSGHTLLGILTQPIPRLLWPDKPLPTETVVNRALFAESGPVRIGSGWAWTMPGGFHIEFGLAGVLLGMFLFGVLCRTLWVYHRNHDTVMSQMILAVSLPAILLFQRGGITVNDTTWYLIYLVPVLLGLVYARNRESVRVDGENG